MAAAGPDRGRWPQRAAPGHARRHRPSRPGQATIGSHTLRPYFPVPALKPDPLRELIRQTLDLSKQTAQGGAVICLCAAWCGVCREFQAVFDEVAQAHPELAFRWLDVEDEADRLGDLDVETFPTLLIGSPDHQVRFLGPVLPQAPQVERLLRTLPR